MTGGAFYNEWEPYAAQWLRGLSAAGHIIAGNVDARSIEYLTPGEVAGYTQAHFFAGIGGWPYALGLAGWPATRPVWTASLPCQPFSNAGLRKGTDDHRHLWPVFRELVAECLPPVIFGEQVASRAGRDWLAGVRSDLEALGYAVGAADLCAASAGAPHIRQRLWWAAQRPDDPASARCDGTEQRPEGPARNETRLRVPSERRGDGRVADAERGAAERHGYDLANAPGGPSGEARQQRLRDDFGHGVPTGGMADADQGERGRWPDGEGRAKHGQAGGREQGDRFAQSGGIDGRRADARGARPQERERDGGLQCRTGRPHEGQAPELRGAEGWRASYWHHCLDGKYRRIPIEPGVLTVVDGLSRGMGLTCADGQTLQQEVLKIAAAKKTGPAEVLRDLWREIGAFAKREWAFGGPGYVLEASVLLAFMRERPEEGRGFAEGVACASAETPQTGVRGLWGETGTASATARSSRQRGLAEQPAGEPSDALRQLSQVLAYVAAQKGFSPDAPRAYRAFPLAISAPGRVGQLRAYGNAIVPQVAATFVRAFMECEKIA